MINYYIFFSIAGLINMILLLIIFFSKKTFNLYENKIYKLMLFVTIFGIILELLMTFFTPIIESFDFLKYFIAKLFLIVIEFWIFLLAIYTAVVSNNTAMKTKKKIERENKRLFILYLIGALITILLPINIVYNDTKTSWLYTYGYSTKFVFVVSIVFILISLIYILKYNKNLKSKKYYPMYAYIILGTFVSPIQQIVPQALLLTFAESIVMLLMYHTIENPDMKMIEQLNIAREHAEKANKAKTDFLSSMSHEIRTPLNAIVGFSECIGQADNLEEAKENANDVIKASQTLLEIVNGILDISKIEAGKIEITNSNYETKELFESTSRLIKARLGNKPLDFRINIAEDIPEVLYGDKFNLKKVMINLLTNAIKYTDEGFVEFKVHCIKNNDACRLIISVEDSGRGIKTEDMDKLFTKFNRIDEDRNTTIEGTGLGLAITKQLVELMNGKIVVQSVYGKGSRFTVALDQRISNEVVETKEVVEQKELDLTGYKVIVVDDNNLNLKVAKKVLEKYNLDISLISSGLELIKLLEQGNTYDLILLDDMMPDMRGTEVIKKLKEMPNFTIPTVALTANAITGMKEKYLKDGFDDFLSKPIEKDELYKVLYKYIYSKKQQNNEQIVQETKPVEQPIQPIELDLTGKKILVVDDNKLNIKVATNLLKKYNVEISSAASGQECIDKINNGETYDLIFMDDMMPEMSGVETFHKLKEKETFNIPVCMLTANAIEGMREKYLSEGFNEYLSKPINKEELVRILKELLLN